MRLTCCMIMCSKQGCNKAGLGSTDTCGPFVWKGGSACTPAMNACVAAQQAGVIGTCASRESTNAYRHHTALSACESAHLSCGEPALSRCIAIAGEQGGT